MSVQPVRLAALVLLGGLSAFVDVSGGGTRPSAIARLHVSGAVGAVDGTCFLAHIERGSPSPVLYFITASHLFNPQPLGAQHVDALRLRVILNDGSALETDGAAVVFPAGTVQGADIAVFRIEGATSSPDVVPISTVAPDPGTPFVIRGYRNTIAIELSEHVRFRSTRLVLGDRTAPEVSELIGSPAMIGDAAFGVASECSATRVPVVTLLSAASDFLARAIPNLRVQATTRG